MWLSYIFISNYISLFEYEWIILLIFTLEIYGNNNVWDVIGIREGIFSVKLKLCFIVLYSKSDGLRIIPKVLQFK